MASIRGAKKRIRPASSACWIVMLAMEVRVCGLPAVKTTWSIGAAARRTARMLASRISNEDRSQTWPQISEEGKSERRFDRARGSLVEDEEVMIVEAPDAREPSAST